jgi:hypothetical protein
MRQELAISLPYCQQTSLCKDAHDKYKKKNKYIGQFSASFSADTKQTTGGREPQCITAPTQKAGFRVPKTVLWAIKH